jgi:hypothetical protein
MAQLADARQRRERAAAEESQARTRMEMGKKELDALMKRWKEVEREAGEGKKGVERMGKEVEGLKAQVAKSGWSEEKEKEVEGALNAARGEVRKAREVSFSEYMRDFAAERYVSIEMQCVNAPAGSRSTIPRPDRTSIGRRSRGWSRHLLRSHPSMRTRPRHSNRLREDDCIMSSSMTRLSARTSSSMDG